MVKVALITDQHFGQRGDSLIFHHSVERFYNEIFFPYLEEHNISRIVMLGDTFDRRKFINFKSLELAKQYYFDVCAAKGLKLDILVGNHDIAYKNTLQLNSPALLLSKYSNVTIHDTPREIELEGLKVLMLPWLCHENYAMSLEAIKNTTAKVAFGHLEIKGFEMYRGVFNDYGLEGNILKQFDLVCSGHFHHKSTGGNINYLGAPYEITWSDYDDPRGFHIFDTETQDLEHIVNPIKMFHKITYDDTGKSESDVTELPFEDYKGCYTKVIIRNKENPFWFDKVIEGLQNADAAAIQIVEDHLWLDIDDEDIVDEAEDILTILSKYVDGLDVQGVDKKSLDKLLRSLYTEALTMQ